MTRKPRKIELTSPDTQRALFDELAMLTGVVIPRNSVRVEHATAPSINLLDRAKGLLAVTGKFDEIQKINEEIKATRRKRLGTFGLEMGRVRLKDEARDAFGQATGEKSIIGTLETVGGKEYEIDKAEAEVMTDMSYQVFQNKYSGPQNAERRERYIKHLEQDVERLAQDRQLQLPIEQLT